MGIVVFGAVFVDIKGYPISTYIPGGRNVGRVETVHGGVSRNVAEDIANVELRPTFVSVVDDTALGDEIIKQLNRHKVNTNYIRRIPDGIGTWLAIFGNDGDVIASISKRPDLTVILDTLDKYGEEIISNCDSVVVEIDIDPRIIKHVLRYAHKYGKTVYAVVSNMSLAMERRDLLQETGCLVCNQQEAGQFFSENFDDCTPEELADILHKKIYAAKIDKMVITMGDQGAVYADIEGDYGIVNPVKVDVIDTTGAGDAFFSGVAIGLTYGKTLKESCEIGTRLASSVIGSTGSVCPRFMPSEFGIEI